MPKGIGSEFLRNAGFNAGRLEVIHEQGRLRQVRKNRERYQRQLRVGELRIYLFFSRFKLSATFAAMSCCPVILAPAVWAGPHDALRRSAGLWPAATWSAVSFWNNSSA